MYNKIMLTIIAICMCTIAYYSRKSCQLPYENIDEDIRIEENTGKMLLTLNFAAQLFDVVPETTVYQDGKYKYLPASNQGFVARVINQMRRDCPRYYAYKEVAGEVKKQADIARYRYICWLNKQRQAEIDDLAEAQL